MAYGRHDINLVMEHLQDRLGPVPMDGTRLRNRLMCKNLIAWASRDYPEHDPVAIVKRLIDIATEDGSWHSQNCTSMSYIHRNKGRLIKDGMRSRSPAPRVNNGPYRIVRSDE